MGTKSQSAAAVGHRSFLGNDSLPFSTLVAAGKVCAVKRGYFDLVNYLKRRVTSFSSLQRLTVPESKFCVLTGTRGPSLFQRVQSHFPDQQYRVVSIYVCLWLVWDFCLWCSRTPGTENTLTLALSPENRRVNKFIPALALTKLAATVASAIVCVFLELPQPPTIPVKERVLEGTGRGLP